MQRKIVKYRALKNEGKTKHKGPWRNNLTQAINDAKNMDGIVQEVEMGCPVRIKEIKIAPS